MYTISTKGDEVSLQELRILKLKHWIYILNIETGYFDFQVLKKKHRSDNHNREDIHLENGRSWPWARLVHDVRG